MRTKHNFVEKKHLFFYSFYFWNLNLNETFVAKYSGKIQLPYGEKESDIILQNKKTSEALKAPMTVYVGDGSDGGFNSAYVSLCA